MELNFEQQTAYLDNVDSMNVKATELENEARDLYARVEVMAKELSRITCSQLFGIKYRAYQALLHEADIAKDAAVLARSFARVAILKFIDEVPNAVVH